MWPFDFYYEGRLLRNFYKTPQKSCKAIKPSKSLLQMSECYACKVSSRWVPEFWKWVSFCKWIESQFCKYAYSYLLSLGIVKNIYSHVFRCTIWFCWNPAHGFYTYSLILLKPPHGYTRTKMWVIGWSSLRVQRALLPRKHFTNVLFNKNFQPAGFAPAVPENGENIDESSTCLLP